MGVAFATRGFARTPDADALLARAEAIDVRSIYLSAPLAGARSLRADLRSGGVAACGVAVAKPAHARDFERALADAAGCASHLRADAVIVDGGVRGEDREAAADRLVRALHGPLRAGVPISVRNPDSSDGLLGLEEFGWLRSELPGVGLWFDPLAAWVSDRAADSDALQAWLDEYAGLVGGVFVHGVGSDGGVGRHPTEGGPAWGSLVATLPRRVPWVLDLGPDLDSADVSDAARWLRGIRS